MRIQVITNLNTRIGGPGRTFQKGKMRIPGEIIEVLGKINGEDIDDNNIWYNDPNGNYYWSGGVSEMLSASQSLIKPPLTPTIVIPNSEANSSWLNFLGIAEIWKITKGESVNVAILDSGINLSNPELASRLFSSTGDPVNNIIDGSKDVTDQFGHGTMCSSLVSFENNTIQIGVAPNAKLYVGKISAMGEMIGYEMMRKGVLWAAEIDSIDIISISFGQNQNDSSLEEFADAINFALSKNKIIVAAIGDKTVNSNPVYPALFENCISVAACDTAGNAWDGNVDWINTTIYAPGVDITTYVVKNVFFPEGDTKPSTLSGTSQATAITAGIIALIISYLKKKGVSYTNNSIKDIITSYYNPLQTDSAKKIINPLKIFSNI